MGWTDYVEDLLVRGADPTEENLSGLMFATEAGHDGVVRVLLSHLRGEDVRDAYDLAVKYERQECVDVLAAHSTAS